MLFRRRKPATFADRLSATLWPRKGATRSLRYFGLSILRIRATPHAIAAGVAAGVVSSCTPFLGLHTIMAFAFAWLVGGNMIAAVLGTAFGNPLTFPLIWSASYRLGHAMLGVAPAHDGATLNLVALFEHLEFAKLWDPVLKPMLLGSLPLELAFGGVFYLLTLFGVRQFQRRRQAYRHSPKV
ncbi:DUF2062 domain-containing protein [Pararhizobium sp.]|uniref:DUF2062 domain-containing protein n=1 Tax=Pararhizobium sp. TaxID=1977563 RepID=UPI0027198AF1|nr:DUF2062 domain-containing protein [Pararhizobium sp.]MDO9417491.1 DUF2062 domain-containing protein [Pararhizobium sp.]